MKRAILGFCVVAVMWALLILCLFLPDTMRWSWIAN